MKPKQWERYRRGSRVQAHVCELELPFAVFPCSYCWSAWSLVAITNTDIGTSQQIQSQFTQIVTLHRRLPQIHTYDHIIVRESTELRFSHTFEVFTDSHNLAHFPQLAAEPVFTGHVNPHPGLESRYPAHKQQRLKVRTVSGLVQTA